MFRALVEVGRTTLDLTPSLIESSSIIEGNPIAQASVLSKSRDGQAWTVVWQCSEGKFNWNYNVDETFLILDGSIILENATMPPTRYGPGDVIYFKKGAQAKWHVERNVRKLAFCRKTQPLLLGYALRAFSKIKRFLTAESKRSAISR